MTQAFLNYVVGPFDFIVEFSSDTCKLLFYRSSTFEIAVFQNDLVDQNGS